MSSTIKRQNHRIHPCNRPRKNELIHFLIERNNGKKILVVTSNEEPMLQNLFIGENVTVLSDAALSATADLRCEVLISYDLPEKAIVYMSRFARASEYALITLDAEDQKRLYPIELLNGRTIVQEIVKGFEPGFGIVVDNQQKAEAASEKAARQEKYAAQDAARGLKPRRDPNVRDTDYLKKPSSKDDGFMAKKQQGNKPRFIGKDENGKPIFEGKTRERNHYIDGTPRSDAEKASRAPYKNKPKFFNDDKNSADKKPYGEKKPYGDKSSFGDKKPYGDKKPFDKDKKPYGDKPSFGDKKPYGNKKPYDAKKSFDKPVKTDSKPARTPRRIDVKSLKPKENKE